MTVPIHGYPTRKPINFLAKEFNYRNESNIQDWQYEVTIPNDLDKYIATYTRVNDEAIRFTLMLMFLEVINTNGEGNENWMNTKPLLKEDFYLHAYTFFYRYCFDNENIEDCFYITPFMRMLWKDHTEKDK